MKKIIVIFLCLQVIWAASSVEERADEDTLATVLSAALGIKVTRGADENLILEGSQADLERAREILSDLSGLRQHFLPVSRNFTNVTGVIEKITTWDACFKALGINPDEVGLVNIGRASDTGKELLIPTDTVTNGEIADIYVKALRRHSAFFNWVYINLKEFVTRGETDKGTHLVIRYGLLNQFLFMEKMEIVAPVIPASDDEHVAPVADTDVLPAPDLATDTLVPANRRLVVSAPSILRRLIAAGSGDVTLEPVPGRSGEYWFRTISLGRAIASGPSRSTVDVAIDVSGSMAGEKIAAINAQIPSLLEQFRNTLKVGTELMVRVYSFADEINHEGDFLLAPGKKIPSWKNLVIRGGTDLTLVAKMIPSQAGDGPRVVVGFTDGEHACPSSSLKQSMTDLTVCQGSGSFARPRLCRVGPKTTESDKFFGSVARVFDGAYDEHQEIGSFCAKISRDASSLLQIRTPVVLDLSGTRVVLWQPDDEAGLYQAPHTVRAGSAITHHGVTSTVDVGASVASALVDPRLARLAELRAAQLALEAEIAADKKI